MLKSLIRVIIFISVPGCIKTYRSEKSFLLWSLVSFLRSLSCIKRTDLRWMVWMHVIYIHKDWKNKVVKKWRFEWTATGRCQLWAKRFAPMASVWFLCGGSSEKTEQFYQNYSRHAQNITPCRAAVPKLSIWSLITLNAIAKNGETAIVTTSSFCLFWYVSTADLKLRSSKEASGCRACQMS